MNKKYLLFIALIVLFANTYTIAQEITGKVNFHQNDLIYTIENGEVYFTLKECENFTISGYPALPVYPQIIHIPSHQKVDSIAIYSLYREKLNITLSPQISPIPHILSLPYTPSPQDNKLEQFFNQKGILYPEKILFYENIKYLDGEKIIELLIYPLQYSINSEWYFNKQIEYILYLSPDDNYELPILKDTKKTTRTFNKNTLTPEECEYLIITSEQLEDTFNPLIEWKNEKGLPSAIITLEEIIIISQGDDIAEQIREYIKTIYQLGNLHWVLLAGDTNIIPERSAYAMTCDAGIYADEDEIPCDLYYADLDGNWDANENNIYGEVADSIDLYPEIIIGRAPIETITEAETFTQKVLQYEKEPNANFLEKILFLSSVLWSNPFTDSGIASDLIIQNIITEENFTIARLYETLGNVDKANVLEHINSSYHIISHSGHANYNIMCFGGGPGGYLSNEDLTNLSNQPNTSIFLSIGCWPAAFDYECIAESFLNNNNGGGLAFIGNSRYGWGSPGNPLYGISDKYMNRFYYELFKNDNYHLGETLASTKMYYAPFCTNENVYRWCQYELNLLGDPELPIHTAPLDTFIVLAPIELMAETENIMNIYITDKNDIPLSDVRVCLSSDSFYTYQTTDVSGYLNLDIPILNCDSLLLTITAHNFKPFQRNIPIIHNIAHLSNKDYYLSNNDRNISLGAEETLYIILSNTGSDSSSMMALELNTDNEHISLIDTLKQLPILASGEEYILSFRIKLDCNNHNSDIISLFLNNIDKTYNWALPLKVLAADIIYQGYEIREGDFTIGNSVSLAPIIYNVGEIEAESPQVILKTDDPYLTISGVSTYAPLPANSTSVSNSNLILDISEDCPLPYSAKISIHTSSNTLSPISVDTLQLILGYMTLEENVENPSDLWQFPDEENNLWHISTKRFFSSNRSFYAGDKISATYPNYTDCILLLPNITLGNQAELSFWHWYDMPVYGSDGLYIEIKIDTVWYTIDFLGGGGALDNNEILHQKMWFQEKYQLDNYAGKTIDLRFRFFSDATDYSEGWYLDDICISGLLLSSLNQDDTEYLPTLPKNYYLGQNFPNPFNNETIIPFQISSIDENNLYQKVSLKVYNIKGELVSTILDNASYLPGLYRLSWSAKNEVGQALSNGIYFYQLEVGSYKYVKAMIYIK